MSGRKIKVELTEPQALALLSVISEAAAGEMEWMTTPQVKALLRARDKIEDACGYEVRR